MMSEAESFHDKWRSFLSESKSKGTNISEIDAVGAIGNTLKKYAGMGQRPRDRRDRLRSAPRYNFANIETPEQAEMAALVVRGVNAIEKTSSEKELAALLKSDFFVELHKSNPEVYDLMINSASREKIATVIAGFVALMLAGAKNSIAELLDSMKVTKPQRIAEILNRNTGYESKKNLEKLLTFDRTVIAEEEAAFNSAMERNLSIIFKTLKLNSQKFIVANAILGYWNRVISANAYDLSEQQLLAARTVFKFQSDWIKENINIEDLDNTRNKNHADIKKAANNPEVKALLTTSL